MNVHIKYRTRWASGYDSWEYKLMTPVNEEDYEHYKEDFVQNIHSKNDWSDKYRGVDIERLEDKDLPVEWIDEQIKNAEFGMEYKRQMKEYYEQLKKARGE